MIVYFPTHTHPQQMVSFDLDFVITEKYLGVITEASLKM